MSEINDKVDIICRQTTYTKEEAIEKLQLHENNHTNVIKEYLGYTIPTHKPKSINQQIYSQLRTFMDDVNESFEKRRGKQ